MKFLKKEAGHYCPAVLLWALYDQEILNWEAQS
jgi:hypothetical protein